VPRLTSRKGACAEHGAWCKRGGGSDFTSERCRKPEVDRYGARIDPPVTDDSGFEMAELWSSDGTRVNRAMWDRFSPARKAAEVDNWDGRLAALIRAEKKRHEAENPQPVPVRAPSKAPVAREPAVSVTPAADLPRRPERPQEPTEAEVATEPSAPAAEPPTPRKRRRRRPQFSSITPINGTCYI